MYDEILKHIRERIPLSDGSTEAIARSFIPKKVRKKQYILNAGDKCEYMTFVERGLLRSFSVDDAGGEHVMQFAMEGWWITDMASFLCGDPAIYNIEALEDCELLMLTRQGMDELIAEAPEMERYFRILMQSHIIALQRRIRAGQSYSAEEVYVKLMEVQPKIVTRAPLQYIASYLGITPETLSRIRKNLARKK